MPEVPNRALKSPPLTPPRGRPDAAAARAPAPAARGRGGDAGDAEAEFVSLEEADAEARGKKPAATAKRSRAPKRRIELDDEALDDATFIEEQEEGDEDVTDIIGDVENEEEA